MDNISNMDEKLTQAEAAKLLGVSRSCASQLLSSGVLEGGFEGGGRFVYKASAETLIRGAKKSRENCVPFVMTRIPRG